MSFPRRRIFRWALFGGVPLAGGSFAYGSFVERHRVEITRPQLDLDLGPASPSKLRVALLGDFHYDPLCEGEFIRHCVDLCNAERPDIILLLGDFVSDHADCMAELAPILGELRAPAGVHAVLGNHDFWHEPNRVQQALESAGIRVLRNELVALPIHDGELLLAGLESAWGGRPDAETLHVNGSNRILLAHHEPDHIDHLPSGVRDNVALQVSGHTHGGQICAPLGIVLARVSWGNRYTKGLYETGRSHVYVNRGIGTLSIHARFSCRPEITMMEIHNTSRRELPA